MRAMITKASWKLRKAVTEFQLLMIRQVCLDPTASSLLYLASTNDIATDLKDKLEKAELSTFIGPQKQLWVAPTLDPRPLPRLASEWWDIFPELLNLLVALLFTGTYLSVA
jgi:hypothetical protein